METLAADQKVDMEVEETIDRVFERRVVRKVDMQLIPILFLLLIFAFLDRINIGNARIMGLEEDLNMKGMDYNIALFTFFITYILFEIPSNIVLKKVKPSVWLSSLIMGWGENQSVDFGSISLTSLTNRYCDNLSRFHCQLCGLGRLSGSYWSSGGRLYPWYVIQSPLWSGMWIVQLIRPSGCVYLISMYYPRFEVQRRLTIQFSGSVFAGAVSGVGLPLSLHYTISPR